MWGITNFRTDVLKCERKAFINRGHPLGDKKEKRALISHIPVDANLHAKNARKLKGTTLRKRKKLVALSKGVIKEVDDKKMLIVGDQLIVDGRWLTLTSSV